MNSIRKNYGTNRSGKTGIKRISQKNDEIQETCNTKKEMQK